MTTLTIRVILKAFGYTVILLAGALILAMIAWAVTANQGLTTCTFWSGLFLGILAVFTDELQQREALVLQQSREQTAVTARSNVPMLTQYVPGTFQVSTKTIVDLNLSIFGLKLAFRTDVERSKSVLGEYMPINQITQD